MSNKEINGLVNINILQILVYGKFSQISRFFLGFKKFFERNGQFEEKHKNTNKYSILLPNMGTQNEDFYKLA